MDGFILISVYIMTNSSDFKNCPVGVTEGSTLIGWDGQPEMNIDSTFLIDCHKDE